MKILETFVKAVGFLFSSTRCLSCLKIAMVLAHNTDILHYYCSHSSIAHDQLLRTLNYCADSIINCTVSTIAHDQILLAHNFCSHSHISPSQLLHTRIYCPSSIITHTHLLRTLKYHSLSMMAHTHLLLTRNYCRDDVSPSNFFRRV